jgi:hypothetical protein
MDTAMNTVSATDFEGLKRAFVTNIPTGDALKLELKNHNKVQKQHLAAIYSYLREHNLMSVDLGGVTLERVEKTTIKVNMATLEEFVENPADLEAYKRENAVTTESLKVHKPKRQRTQ